MHGSQLRAQSPLLFGLCVITLGMLVALLRSADPDAPSGPPLALFGDEPAIKVLLKLLDPGSCLEIETPVVIADAAGATLEADGDLRLELGLNGVTGRSTSLLLPLEITASEEVGIGILGRRYHGIITIQVDEGRIAVINSLPLETYLRGVVFAEMGAWFPDEALKAQALVSRSYAVHHLMRRTTRPWNVRATQRSQVYRGISLHPQRAARLVAASCGLILAYEGKVVPGFFSSSCGGATRPAGEAFGGVNPPPLDGVVCGFCDRAPGSRWELRMPLDEFRLRLGWKDPILGVSNVQRAASGRLRRMSIVQEGESHDLSLARLRKTWNEPLPSTWITAVETTASDIVLEGRGFGHGVGLCQHGARTLAMAGQTYGQILTRFFPGAVLARAWPCDP